MLIDIDILENGREKIIENREEAFKGVARYILLHLAKATDGILYNLHKDEFVVSMPNEWFERLVTSITETTIKAQFSKYEYITTDYILETMQDMIRFTILIY